MVQIGACEIHVVDRGQGAPTLFLHGIPDSSEIWAELIAELSGAQRCIAPDLPGFGDSTAPADFDCSLEGMAGFVDALLTALGIDEPVHLVVHDIGGPYGLAWAVLHPQKVRSLVIMNTLFFPDFRWHLFARLWRTPLVGELVQALTTRRSFIGELRRGSRKLSKAQMQRTFERVTPALKKMVLRWYRATDPAHFSGWEQRLVALCARLPSLVLWAGHDPYIERRFATRFGAREIEYFEDSGHWLPAEEAQQVAARMQLFYARQA